MYVFIPRGTIKKINSRITVIFKVGIKMMHTQEKAKPKPKTPPSPKHKENQEQKRQEPYRKQNDSHNSNHINNHIKCEWIKHFFHRAEIVRDITTYSSEKLKT